LIQEVFQILFNSNSSSATCWEPFSDEAIWCLAAMGIPSSVQSAID
jgi:hypothetical protein